MSPLRVAMVSEFAYPVLGGVSEHVHFLSRGLAALGHDVTVVTSNVGDPAEAAELDRRAFTEHGYRTVRLGRSVPVLSNGSISRASVGLGLKHRLGEALRGADVVHAQGLAPPTLPLFALRASVAPVTVGTFHTYFSGGHWAYRTFFMYVKTALSRMDRKIAVSDACVQALEPYFPGPYEVIPNGIDTGLYRPLGPGEAAPGGPARILFVGRFDPRNALGDLLEAAARLRDEGREFVVQVVGDGPARRFYEKKARRLGLWDRTEWLGLVNEDRPRLYREATVLAAPCVLASFGVVLLEAMSCGIPLVCADNIGFRQVIRDGAPGRFVPPHDPAALAAALGEVLDDPALRADWGSRGRRVAEDRFAWEHVARRIEDLYLEVMAEKGRLVRPAVPV